MALHFTLSSITEDDACRISRWHYAEPYKIYDGCDAAIPDLMNPRYRYHGVQDEHGVLAGFFCFGEDARVPEGVELGLYDDESLDVGLGMRPDLTGRGIGRRFVEAGLDFAYKAYSPDGFRMTVAAFNRRAVRVYEMLGFAQVAEFGRRTSEGEPKWLLMQNRV